MEPLNGWYIDLRELRQMKLWTKMLGALASSMGGSFNNELLTRQERYSNERKGEIFTSEWSRFEQAHDGSQIGLKALKRD